MYNNKSAKDLLSQFPKRMAEGGEATKEPAAAAVGSTPSEWAAPAITPNLVGDVASTSFAPVAARTTQLTPISQLSVSPSTLSASQQFARDRAAQQDLLKSVLAQSGAPLSSLEQRALQQKIYAGDINAGNINEEVLYPLYEERLRNAYKAVGLGGVNESRQAEYDAYLNQLKEGKIAGADFENKFLTDIANYSGADKFDAGRLASINKAREALKMPLLVKPIDPYARSGFGQFYGSNNFMGGPMYQNQGRSIFNLNSVIPKPAAPAPEIKPVDFSKPSTTQLFAEGGEVSKIDEQEQDFSNLSEEDRKRLAMILEQRSLQGARMNLGPVPKEQNLYSAGKPVNLFGVKSLAEGGPVKKSDPAEELGLTPEQYAKAVAGLSMPKEEVEAITEPTTTQKYTKEILDLIRPSKEGIYGRKEDVDALYADMYGQPSGRYFDTGKDVLNKLNVIPKFPAAGMYTSGSPEEVTVNVNSGLPSKGVFVHEFQHKLDDDQRNNRNNRSKKESFPEAYVRDLSGTEKWKDTSSDYSTLNDNVKSAFSTYRKKYQLGEDFVDRGLIPELKRIESTLPVGKNIFDTDIGKAVSKGLPNFKFAYYNQTKPSKGTYMYSAETAEQAGAPIKMLDRYTESKKEKGVFDEPVRKIKSAKQKATDFIKSKQFKDGGDVKKSGSSKAEPWGEGRESEIIEGNPYGDSSGRPLIKDKGPSAMDVAKFINSFLPVTGDIQSAAEGYQAFKDKYYLGAALGAAGVIPFIPNTTKYVRGIPYEGSKSIDKFLRNDDIPFVTVPIDKNDMFSSTRAYDVQNQIENRAGAEGRSRIFYHAGNAGIGGDTTARNMGGGRDTGHFGTGTYAVTKQENLPPFYTESRPVSALITRPEAKLFLGNTEELDKAHKALRKVNRLAGSEKLLPKDKILKAMDDIEYRMEIREKDPELYEMIKLVEDARFDLPGSFMSSPEKMIDAANEHIKARLGAGGSFWKERVQRDSASTRYMKGRGYDGVNTGLAPELDNTTYGSVIYRKKKFAHGGEVTKFIKSKK